jgi:carbamoyl-phosphate synthase large subunit
MILGAGLTQVPLIQKVKDRGFTCIVVSRQGDYPGFALADKAYTVDVVQKETICELARQEKITGILTDQTDLAVPSVAYVAEQLGLPGVGYDCSLRFTNKHLMRRLCQDIGVPVPKSILVKNSQEACEAVGQLGVPCICKPADSQGSRGVSRVNTLDEVGNKYLAACKCSQSNAVLVEELILGHEVVVQGFAYKENFVNLVVGDREYFDLQDLFIPSQTIFPSRLGREMQDRLLDINTKLINAFAPRFGITHCEYLVNEQTGDIHLVEAAIRGGGVFISSDLVPLAAGVDVTQWLIQAVCGEEVVLDQAQVSHQTRSAAYACFYLPQGRIQNIQGLDQMREVPGVYKSYVPDFHIGDSCPGILDKTMRSGPVLIAGQTRQECEQCIQEIQKTLLIEIMTNDGVQGIRWS